MFTHLQIAIRLSLSTVVSFLFWLKVDVHARLNYCQGAFR